MVLSRVRPEKTHAQLPELAGTGPLTHTTLLSPSPSPLLFFPSLTNVLSGRRHRDLPPSPAPCPPSSPPRAPGLPNSEFLCLLYLWVDKGNYSYFFFNRTNADIISKVPCARALYLLLSTPPFSLIFNKMPVAFPPRPQLPSPQLRWSQCAMCNVQCAMCYEY